VCSMCSRRAQFHIAATHYRGEACALHLARVLKDIRRATVYNHPTPSED
jgi:hypothetical protein